jgi:hypothetical protein
MDKARNSTVYFSSSLLVSQPLKEEEEPHRAIKEAHYRREVEIECKISERYGIQPYRCQ